MTMLTAFVAHHKEYFFFCTGLLYGIVGVSILFYRKFPSLFDTRIAWSWFAFFAFLRGLSEWMNVCVDMVGTTPGFMWTQAALMAAAYFCFAECVRRTLMAQRRVRVVPYVIYGFMAAVIVGGIVQGAYGFRAMLEYVCGFCGALALVYACITELSFVHVYKKVWIALACCFGVYAIAQGMVGVMHTFFFDSVLHPYASLVVFEISMQLLSCIALVTSIGLIRLFSLPNKQTVLRHISVHQLCAVLILAVLVAGGVLTDRVTQGAKHFFMATQRQFAEMSAASLNMERIRALSGTSADSETSDYQRLKMQLFQMKQKNPFVCFLYVVRMKENQIVFLVDNEMPESPDISLPGDVYHEAPEELREVFTSGHTVTCGPFTDRWGSFVSTFIPLYCPGKTTVCAVFGLDMSARELQMGVFLARLFPLSAILFCVFVIMVLYGIRVLDNESAVRLRRSELHYRNLVEGSPNGIILCSKEGRILSTNRHACELFGKSRETMVGCFLPSLFPEGSFSSLQSALQQAGAGSKVEKEVMYVSLNKAQHAWNMILSPIALESGVIATIMCVIADCTERKEAEEARKRIEEDYHLLFSQMMSGMAIHEIICDPFGEPYDYRFLQVNPAFERITGIKAHDVVGKRIREVMPDIEPLWVERYGKVALTGQPLQFEEYNESLRKYFDVRAFSPEKGKFVVTFNDITTRKQGEKALRDEHNILMTLLDGIPDIISLQKPDNTIVAYNRAGYQWLHTRPEVVIGKKCYEVMGASSMCDDCPAKQAIATRKIVTVERYEPRMNEWIEFRAIPIVDSQGMVTMLVEQLHTITERKKQEEMARRAKEAAESANKVKSQFLANMSHEVRTPLNAILGFSDLLAETPLNGEQRSYVDTVRESGDALLTLINDILDVSKIEAQELRFEQTVFNLSHLMESTINIIRPRLRGRDVELIYAYSDMIPEWFKGDPARIRQIILNFLGNAIKFTETGDIVLSIEKEVLVSQAAVAHAPILMVRFSVRDQGIGIPQDKQHLLFTPFSQVDASSTRKYGGTGLGLYISKSIAHAMGGRIWFHSELGRGSEFMVTLPLRTVSYDECPIREIPSVLRGKRVVIIDQRKETALQIKRYADLCSMDILGIWTHVSEALAWCEHNGHVPDAILFDHAHGPDEGDSLTTYVETHEHFKQTKCVFLEKNGEQKEIHPRVVIALKPFLFLDFVRTMQSLWEAGVLATISPERMGMATSARVLIVEDNMVNLKLIEVLLERIGCTIDTATGGREATEKVRANTYDMILMDIQMPDLDGIQATQIIRKEINQAIPIIALTAGVQSEDREKALRAGMNDFLTKPINVRQLTEKIIQYGYRG